MMSADRRAVRLAAEVGDVDRDAAAGLELASALGEHLAEHLEVLEVDAGMWPSPSSSSYALPAKYGGEVTTRATEPSASASIDPRVAAPRTVRRLVERRPSSSVESSGRRSGRRSAEASWLSRLADAEVRRGRGPSLPHRSPPTLGSWQATSHCWVDRTYVRSPASAVTTSVLGKPRRDERLVARRRLDATIARCRPG